MSLSLEKRKSFQRNGFLFPVRVLDPTEAFALLDRIDAVPPERVAGLAHPWYYKSYLLFPWMNDLVRHTAVLDVVEDLLGHDIVVMSADIWRKAAGETRHISWHQDAAYWELDPLDIVTAWVALTPATAENGCMRFAPGSQAGRREHANTFAADNILSHGQTICPPIDEPSAVAGALHPGEMSVHHALLAHDSGPNRTSERRVGVAIRYLAGHVQQLGGPPISAMTVRGTASGNLVPEQAPAAELSPEAIALHARLLEPHASRKYVTF